jgi:hypothetical protein
LIYQYIFFFFFEVTASRSESEQSGEQHCRSALPENRREYEKKVAAIVQASWHECEDNAQ